MSCFLKIGILLFFVSDSFARIINPRANIICSVTNVFRDVKAIRMSRKSRENIYTFFTPHLFHEPTEIDKILKSTGGTKIVADKLREYLHQKSDKVKLQKKNVSTIVRLLSEKPSVKWMGLEISKTPIQQEGYMQYIERKVKVYFYWKRELPARFQLDLKETDNLLHLIFYDFIIALATHPELFRNIQFVPLEKASFHAVSIEQISRIEQTRQRINAKTGHINDRSVQKIERLIRRFWSPSEQVSPSQIQSALDKIKDPELNQLFKDHFSNLNQFMENVMKRSEAMALTAGKQSGEGLIIVGSGHRKKVTAKLLSLCRGS